MSAIKHLLRLRRPDLVLTGINSGGHVDEDPRGKPYYWIGPVREDGVAESGTDLAAINEKRVSVTPIYMNLSNFPVLASLKRVFG
jgi:broad specificity polyphosphatase/5'/3'-nucleotidase SurE